MLRGTSQERAKSLSLLDEGRRARERLHRSARGPAGDRGQRLGILIGLAHLRAETALGGSRLRCHSSHHVQERLALSWGGVVARHVDDAGTFSHGSSLAAGACGGDRVPFGQCGTCGFSTPFRRPRFPPMHSPPLPLSQPGQAGAALLTPHPRRSRIGDARMAAAHAPYSGWPRHRVRTGSSPYRARPRGDPGRVELSGLRLEQPPRRVLELPRPPGGR